MNFIEMTVSSAHEAMQKGSFAAKDLVAFYLDRIERLDDILHSVILVNPKALEEAEKLDQYLEEKGAFIGPLHGIPVILKDNVDTKDMQTTAGSKSLEGYVPEKDAFLAKKLRDAGAIILAKANLHEFAIWGETMVRPAARARPLPRISALSGSARIRLIQSVVRLRPVRLRGYALQSVW